jgi:hypothetical protein
MAGEMSEVGLSGLTHTAGIIEEEYEPELVGRKAIDAYKKMRDSDPLVGAILFAVDMLIRQVEWRVEPATNETQDEQEAEFLESCMNDMSSTWSDTISEIMSFLVFGFAFHEIVYKQRSGGPDAGASKKEAGVKKAGDEGAERSRFNDGRIGWRKIPLRGQETLDHWEFDTDGGIKAFVQKAPPDFKDVPIPIEKGLLFRTTSYKNNPEGRSVLRNAYRPAFFKRRIEELEGVGIERDLAGLPMAGVDPAILADDADQGDKKILYAIQNIVKNVRRDTQEGIIWPNAYDEKGNKLYTFELLSAGGSRTFDTSAIIQRYDQRIAMTILADFILLGHEKVGSFALSSSKTDLFAVALGTWLNSIQDIFNRFAVPRLFELNNVSLEELPKIVHGDIENRDLAEIAAYLQALSGVGMPLFPDSKLEGHLRQIGNLPEKEEGEEGEGDEEGGPVANPSPAPEKDGKPDEDVDEEDVTS